MIPIHEIKSRLLHVQDNIEKAAFRSGRKPTDVKLVVVTKAQPVEVVQSVIDAGARILGENYPEETQEKLSGLNLPENLQWHMIGHLQSRKSRIVAENFHYFHALDNFALAQKLDRILAESERSLEVLLECNVGDEETKHGWEIHKPEQLKKFFADVEKIGQLYHLKVRGLMCMPPLFEDPQATRPFFIRLRKLQMQLKNEFSEFSWNELSMGTSTDYEVAIEEGATFIRVGTAIVGPRN